ncbi:GNAT family N-acetyltransferase [Rhodococcus sp. G-MC3]|uniref:GNAT family N-acetyltransferase n=1 Tax=Rhodococcus sp. G-MC3 TaxID=3046209 RepID=UPI0024BAACD6|nr:GNAT family N-acetyltransferase [Rhodococcus sp. G-MC3]MDJ0393278.1 GNAT family N-acetyltransferase [Rhodococcus sp. G-MC3]
MTHDGPALIRPPTADEAAEIAAVHTAVWCSTFGGTVPETFLDAAAEARRTEHWEAVIGFGDREHTVFVAEQDSSIAGLVHAGTEMDRHKIFALYVLEAFHGTGVGQRLLDAVLVDEPTELWVAQNNHRAVAFYRRNGFVPDGTAEDFPGIDGFVTIKLVR